jgi:uncharacterized protein YndB with AHSA1/START domain
MRTIMAALVLVAVPMSAIAKPIIYECEMKDVASAGNWIGEDTHFQIDLEAGTASVFDWMIKEATGKPQEAEIAAKTDKRITLTWRRTDKNVRGKAIDFKYRASIYSDGAIHILAKPLNYSDTWEARGTCVKKAK